MNRFLLAFALAVVCLGSALPARAAWELVWFDEFDGTSLDLSKWEPQIGTGCPNLCGWGNNELQYYRAQNATVSGGFLTITAKQEFFGGQPYTSARLRTKNLGDWTRGRFEMRARLPISQGMWAAFWMLPTDETYGGWAASGEIDIMEYLGHQPSRTFGTLHYGGPFPANTFTSNAYVLPSGNFHDTFHDFALEWDECGMRWYVDGFLYATQTQWYSTGGPYPAPFDQRFHLLLNLAVGGNLPGNPDGTTVFPQEYVIDYVRVYQQSAPDLGSCRQLFDGMEHGSPLSNGWFVFAGSVGGGGIGPNFSDLPPSDGCVVSLQSGWGSGGTPGWVGGFGRTNPLDLSGLTHFTCWVRPDANQSYQIEINLQDDDNGDNSIPSTPDGADDEFHYVLDVSPVGSELVAGGGWQKVSIPLSAFTDDNSFHFGGNGVLDCVPVGEGGNGQLVNVVWSLVTNGPDITFRTDDWEFTRAASGVNGRVWNDANGDGQIDGSETGLAGVRVELWDTSAGAVAAADTTAGDGSYAFANLLGGDFDVILDPATLPAGYVPTADPDGIATPGRFALALTCDESVIGANLGYRDPTTAAPVNSSEITLDNRPNPFGRRTSIRFSLARTENVEVAIYDVNGRLVRRLLQEERAAGPHEIEWDGRDAADRAVAAGTYFSVLRLPESDTVHRLTVLR
ncbi:MAG: family 16 glycosylhydrolase [bacterium]